MRPVFTPCYLSILTILVTTYSICPGRHFALDTLFINIASALHVFDISPPLGDNETPIKLEYDNTDGLLSYVLRFGLWLQL